MTYWKLLKASLLFQRHAMNDPVAKAALIIGPIIGTVASILACAVISTTYGIMKGLVGAIVVGAFVYAMWAVIIGAVLGLRHLIDLTKHH
jgi:hypothetical protein